MLLYCKVIPIGAAFALLSNRQLAAGRAMCGKRRNQ
jgi:hypothetical protein